VTCREFTERLAEHLDGALPNRSDRAVRRHADGCRGCQAYLAQYRATRAAVAALVDWDELDSEDTLELSRLAMSTAARVN
jgi:anti-sigma factor RsiW